MRLTSLFSRTAGGRSARVGALALSLLALSSVSDTAQASGPVERMVQVLDTPSDPNLIVVRYGVATEGFLFSRDGGCTFKAMCSQAIAPDADERDKIRRLSSQRVPSAAATLLDADGKLLVAQLGGLWTDDGTGCSWSKQPELEGLWPYNLKRDPKNPAELVAVVTDLQGEGAETTARVTLMRRDAAGAWSTAGPLVPDAPAQRAYAGELLVTVTETGTRLYASVTVSSGDVTAPELWRVVSSDDGGKTWTAGTPLAEDQQEGLVLLAVDPLHADRVLAALYRDNAPDTLLLSDDAGKTFRGYGQVRETSGVTFAPDGRVFVGDAGDSSGENAVGGVWTAARLGEPLTLIAGTSLVDCISFKPSVGKLQVCKRDRFGLMDPQSGVFEELARLDSVPALLDCPGLDMAAACETQLNAGASWCCAGHYPFTPFCGSYDVTTLNGRRLYCGESGRTYDQNAGRLPAAQGPRSPMCAPLPELDAGQPGIVVIDASAPRSDAGAPPMLAPDAGSPTKTDGGGGCAVGLSAARDGSASGLAFTLCVLALSLSRLPSRRRHSSSERRRVAHGRR